MQLTPYNNDYPTCERTHAIFRIYPGSTLPSEVSERLSLTPTLARTVGEFVPSSLSGHGHYVSRNRWELSSESFVVSKDLRRHLDWLLDRLTPAQLAIRTLNERTEVAAVIHCSWWSAHGQGGPLLGPSHMQRIGDLGLELGFEIMFFGDEEL